MRRMPITFHWIRSVRMITLATKDTNCVVPDPRSESRTCLIRHPVRFWIALRLHCVPGLHRNDNSWHVQSSQGYFRILRGTLWSPKIGRKVLKNIHPSGVAFSFRRRSANCDGTGRPNRSGEPHSPICPAMAGLPGTAGRLVRLYISGSRQGLAVPTVPAFGGTPLNAPAKWDHTSDHINQGVCLAHERMQLGALRNAG
jgi:hypothetical protein